MFMCNDGYLFHIKVYICVLIIVQEEIDTRISATMGFNYI